MSRLLFFLGNAVRETGQALDRLGCRLQGSAAFKEQLSRHRTLMPIYDKVPAVPPTAFVAPNASVIGDVTIGDKSSIWYGCILRGDVNSVKVGSMTNLQDNVVVHVAKDNLRNKPIPTIIGDRVTVGHAATLHACTIEDEAFVGMGATVLDGAKVEKGAMVAAGAVVTQDTVVPSGQIWAGSPAKFLRKLTEQESGFLKLSAENYHKLGVTHLAETSKTFDEIETEKANRKRDEERDEDYDGHVGCDRPEHSKVPSLPYQ